MPDSAQHTVGRRTLHTGFISYPQGLWGRPCYHEPGRKTHREGAQPLLRPSSGQEGYIQV